MIENDGLGHTAVISILVITITDTLSTTKLFFTPPIQG